VTCSGSVDPTPPAETTTRVSSRERDFARVFRAEGWGDRSRSCSVKGSRRGLIDCAGWPLDTDCRCVCGEAFH